MRADRRFLNQELGFWAVVKYVSEQAGYSNRKSKHNPVATIKVLNPQQVIGTLKQRNIDCQSIPSEQVQLVSDYLYYRAQILTNEVEPALMTREQARECFEKIKARVDPVHPIPMNRQKKEKRHEAYLAAMVGMLAEEAVGPNLLINDSQKLAILTECGALRGIFSRRFDGAIPSTHNPIAIWEVKEYYGTKTFGSRVADGVYETLLDGYEINAFEDELKRRIAHYFIC